MKSMICGIVLGLCVILVSAEANRVRRFIDLSEVGDQLSDTLDCKKVNEECRLVPPCCGNMQCYWEHGYNPLGTGVCVTCVDRSQKCQRNSQCCDNLVCQKSQRYDVNGVCDVTKPNGASCHDDDQCTSHFCKFAGWLDFVRGIRGTCSPLA